jgi:hypothetical protein
MHFLQRKDIDCEKWNQLVDQTPNALIYNKSIFLDVLADNWSIYVNDVYSKGIAIPFTRKMNVNTVYTPNFIRSLDVLGISSGNILNDFINSESLRFSAGNLMLNTQVESDGTNRKKFQEILFHNDFEINTLAKRMLKKFDSSEFEITHSVSLDLVLELFKVELFPRISNLNKKDFNLFTNLLIELDKQGVLKTNGALNNKNQLIAVAVFVEYKNRVTYMKGVANKEFMKCGVMYALLNNQILKTRERNFDFDFGGSNLESIARFYKNLGGTDQFYSCYEWGKLPRYYTLIRGIYHKLNKK